MFMVNVYGMFMVLIFFNHIHKKYFNLIFFHFSHSILYLK